MTHAGAIGRRGRLAAGLLVLAGIAVFAVANVHLVYVSVTSQQECVPHAKEPGGPGAAYRAAKPSC